MGFFHQVKFIVKSRIQQKNFLQICIFASKFSRAFLLLTISYNVVSVSYLEILKNKSFCQNCAAEKNEKS